MSQNKQLRSKFTSAGQLQLSIETVDIPTPKSDEVVVKIGAAPINPSDLGLLFGMADMSSARASGSPDQPVITAAVPEKFRKAMAARVDQSLPAGNEGAGVVVAAGDSEAAQSLMGKTVAILGGAMYAQYRAIKAVQCLVLPAGTTAVQGASCFVNPLTALGMVETMKLENHTALVHTAAASNLGQMLQKICIADHVPLVNIVRKAEQVKLLKDLGAEYVVNSSEPSFMDDLTQALKATGATIGFDATGGGKLAGNILTCMEVAASANASEFNRYGSSVHKQVYIYGGLDRSTTELSRSFGMAWSIGGWLLPPFLARIGQDAAQALRDRVAREITTTFASHYTSEVTLEKALTLESIAVFGKQATGEKYLIIPNG